MDVDFDVVEAIREQTEILTEPDDMLNFYHTAVTVFGLSEEDADAVDQELTTRVMRARGAI